MTNNEDPKTSNVPSEIDVANMDVQLHLVIRDVDTDEVLLNTRG